MKLISYQRSATKEHSNKPNSVQKQRSACKFWAIKNKHEIITQFFDNGFGSYFKLAPSFKDILREIVRGDFDFEGVVVHSYSRISRNSLHLIKVKHLLKDHGVTLFSVTEHCPIRPNIKEE